MKDGQTRTDDQVESDEQTKKDLREFFLKRKPVNAIVTLRENQNTEKFALRVSRDIDSTYAHTVKILQEMKSHGLIEFEKDGRRKLISLTPKGYEVSKVLSETWRELEEK